MNPNFLVFIVAISFLIISTVLLLLFLFKKRFRNQNNQMLQLAKDLDLPVYEGLALKSNGGLVNLVKHPLIIEGNYQGKALKIFLFAQKTGNNTRICSAIRILGSNSLGLDFTIVGKIWIQRFWQLLVPKRIILGDSAFDTQFIVKSNKPEIMQKILTDSLRTQFISLHKDHTYKGRLELQDDFMIYVEHHAIDTEHKRKRFEALIDLMCCLRDEIDINFRGN